MSLFFTSFEGDVVPLLIDAHDEEEARVIAKGVADREPSKIKPIPPGLFVAELFTQDEDGNETVCSPLEEIADMLEALDDEDDKAIEACGTALCGAEAQDEQGNPVACGRAPHEEGEHEAVTLSGITVHW